jgi:hypothetical protein
MAVDKTSILSVIDSCIKNTSSKRKKTIGLPALRQDINTVSEENTDLMIAILLNAIGEPEPKSSNAPDTANKYWVNRQSTSLFRGRERVTNTFVALQNVIREYCSNNKIVAAGPKLPLHIKKNKALTPQDVMRMKEASRRLDGEICISGHGQMIRELNPKFKVPNGTYIKFYVAHMGGLGGVDPKSILVPEVWGRHGRAMVFDMYGPGMMCDDYRWGECTPQGLQCGNFSDKVGGCWSETDSSTQDLSKTIVENMGVVHCIFCRAHPTNDEIMMKYYGGKWCWGGEKCELTDAPLKTIGVNGGAPRGFDYKPWKGCDYDTCWCKKPGVKY